MKVLVFILSISIHLSVLSNNSPMKEEIATIGGGCFWCTEAVYEEVKGIIDVVSGYAGGSVINPSYREVTTGRTGHAEVVQIRFNPEVISYKEVLEIFFKTHDPTTLNRQGADVGTQYRSVIFYHSDDQKAIALELINSLNSSGIFNTRIVTQVNKYDHFYLAEDYHQDYFRKNPNQGYCQAVINPKMNKFRKEFSSKLKEL
jgi:peptide-methionine (S)-S-oxide reductase